MELKHRLVIAFEPDLWKSLVQAAKLDRRKPTQYIRVAIEERILRHMVIPSEIRRQTE